MKPSDLELYDELCEETLPEPTVEELAACLREYASVASPSSISELCEESAKRLERLELALNEKRENERDALVKENERLKAKYGILFDLYDNLLERVCKTLSE